MPAILTLVLLCVDDFLAKGILTPLGRQGIIWITTLLSVYLLSAPLTVGLVYKYHISAAPIFLCICSSYVVQTIVYVGRIWLLDWDVEITRCEERVLVNGNVFEEESQGQNSVS